MNLYLLSQCVNNGYDTFDSCVVAAKNELDALSIGPREDLTPEKWLEVWAPVEHIKCELIGKAIRGTEAGVICASFNAG